MKSSRMKMNRCASNDNDDGAVVQCSRYDARFAGPYAALLQPRDEVDQQFEATDEQKAKRSRHARAVAGALNVVLRASPIGLSGAGLKTYLGKGYKRARGPIEFVPEPRGQAFTIDCVKP
jgi:hypothetical protein